MRGVDNGAVERLAYGYELMHRAICNLAGTSGADGRWYYERANEVLNRVSPVFDITPTSNPPKPGDCLTGYRIYTAAMPAPSDQEKLVGEYLVWSNEHSAWWGKDRCGYTRIIANAGRYSRAEALSIAGTRDGGWHVRKGNPDEIAIPEQDAIDQYADITREQDDDRARQPGAVS